MTTEIEKTDDVDIEINAFGDDSTTEPFENRIQLDEKDESQAPVVDTNMVQDIVNEVLRQIAQSGGKPQYPIHPPVGVPKESVRETTGRKPIGRADVLNPTQKDPNYVYRMVNDKDDGHRIQRFIEAGYEPVMLPNAKGFDKKAGADSQMGSAVMKSVGGGMKAILMRIPKVWYDQDQAAKQQRVSSAEKAIKTPYNPNNPSQPNPDGVYGKVEIKHS